MDVTHLMEISPAPRAVFAQLAARGDRPRFLVPTSEGHRAVTWRAFADEIREVALFLLEAGLNPGDRAAVYAPNRVEWMSAALGIEAAAGTMVPVYPASTAEQAAYVVQHSDARVVFVDTPALFARLLAAWDALGAVERVVLLDDALDARAAHAALAARGTPVPPWERVAERVLTLGAARALGRAEGARDPARFERTLAGIDLDQPAVMLYTSGTSGNPKGVPLSHRNVGANGRDWLVCNAPLLDEDAVDLLWLPMSHIFGFGQACLGNTLGFTTYLSDPAQVLGAMPAVRPHVFMSVPAYWEKLATAAAREADPVARRARLHALTGGRLRFCLSGGAGLKREVKELFHDAGVLIIEGYGLTETAPTLTLNRPDAFRFDTVGRPLPSVELTLAADGEILARGPNVFRGYHKDPEATRAAFTADGWFQTGDVGRFTDDGFLQIVDRKKDILVTSGGKNVPPANIEVRFGDEPLFAHVVVYGEGKRYLVAGVWLHDDAVAAALGDAAASDDPAARAAAVRALVQPRLDRVNAQLASYETLKRFAVMPRPLSVAEGLLTASLKVRRKRVYEAFRAEFEALYDDAAPRDGAPPSRGGDAR